MAEKKAPNHTDIKLRRGEEEKLREIMSLLESGKMSLSYDVAFFLAIYDNVGLAQHIVDSVFGKGKYAIIAVSTQHELRAKVGARASRLDFLGRCEDGSLINIEMQRSHTEDVGAKLRMYRAQIDAHFQKPGKGAPKLSRVIILFFVDKDFFGRGEALYPLWMVEKNGGMPFEDGVEPCLINLKHKGRDTPIGKLIGDLTESDPSKIVGWQVRKALQYVQKGEANMWITGIRGDPMEERERFGAQKLNEGIAIGETKGIAIGEANFKKKTILKFHFEDKLPPEKISSLLAITLDEVSRIIAEADKEA